MTRVRLRVVCATIVCAGTVAFALSPTPAAADLTATCPDGYQPVPLIALPPGDEDVDKNGNLIACAKGPQGSNGHFNTKDDKKPQYVDDIV